jgi:uncharacterized protein (DUF2062 family)
MARKFLRRHLPSHESIRQNRHVARFGSLLHHPNLWHLNRKSVSGGVAAGLFAGLVPGSNPVQFAFAVLLAIAFRVNLPVAVVVTLYTNPSTIVPLYVLAYEIGSLFFVDNQAGLSIPPAVNWSQLGASIEAYFTWLLALGKPLALGLLVLAAGLAVVGYGAVQLAWRTHTILAWRRRKAKRATRG